MAMYFESEQRNLIGFNFCFVRCSFLSAFDSKSRREKKKNNNRTFSRRNNILRRILFQFGSSFVLLLQSRPFVRDSQMQWFIMRLERSHVFKCVCLKRHERSTGASYVNLATVRHLNYQFLLVACVLLLFFRL